MRNTSPPPDIRDRLEARPGRRVRIASRSVVAIRHCARNASISPSACVACTDNDPRAERGAYCDCNAFAGFSRAARAAGIVVARHVIAVISSVAIARITGSEARIAYTRLETTWPEK